ncbi:unnamed protein product, partial [Trichogramma brassicae]
TLGPAKQMGDTRDRPHSPQAQERLVALKILDPVTDESKQGKQRNVIKGGNDFHNSELSRYTPLIRIRGTSEGTIGFPATSFAAKAFQSSISSVYACHSHFQVLFTCDALLYGLWRIKQNRHRHIYTKITVQYQTQSPASANSKTPNPTTRDPQKMVRTELHDDFLRVFVVFSATMTTQVVHFGSTRHAHNKFNYLKKVISESGSLPRSAIVNIYRTASADRQSRRLVRRARVYLYMSLPLRRRCRRRRPPLLPTAVNYFFDIVNNFALTLKKFKVYFDVQFYEESIAINTMYHAYSRGHRIQHKLRRRMGRRPQHQSTSQAGSGHSHTGDNPTTASSSPRTMSRSSPDVAGEGGGAHGRNNSAKNNNHLVHDNVCMRTICVRREHSEWSETHFADTTFCTLDLKKAFLQISLRVWIERRHGELNYHLTQLLTGHGFFKHHSRRYDHNHSAQCLSHKQSLQRSYTGPHQVISRDPSKKHMEIRVDNKVIRVPVDQLKPAHFLDQALACQAAPPADRPPSLSAAPPIASGMAPLQPSSMLPPPPPPPPPTPTARPQPSTSAAAATVAPTDLAHAEIQDNLSLSDFPDMTQDMQGKLTRMDWSSPVSFTAIIVDDQRYGSQQWQPAPAEELDPLVTLCSIVRSHHSSNRPPEGLTV